jgi:hypothetical protein
MLTHYSCIGTIRLRFKGWYYQRTSPNNSDLVRFCKTCPPPGFNYQQHPLAVKLYGTLNNQNYGTIVRDGEQDAMITLLIEKFGMNDELRMTGRVRGTTAYPAGLTGINIQVQIYVLQGGESEQKIRDFMDDRLEVWKIHHTNRFGNPVIIVDSNAPVPNELGLIGEVAENA